MELGSLFSGIGGFELGAEWANIQTVWNCEIEKFPKSVLKKRFPHVRQYDDIRTMQNPEWCDIICGGFPCQDISIAGKGEGITGERSGLWSEMWRIIGNVRPNYVIIENSPMLTVRGFEQVLCDLHKIGYDAEWQCLSGRTFGIQQNRERIYCIAYASKIGCVCNGKKSVFQKPYIQGKPPRIYPGYRTRCDLPTPRTLRKHNVLPNQVDRVGSCGNAVMPLIALYLFECIKSHYDFYLNCG
jgi:DNA (cytosine-5)-methyltransferase 1